jgi:hypothetical protein
MAANIVFLYEKAADPCCSPVDRKYSISSLLQILTEQLERDSPWEVFIGSPEPFGQWLYTAPCASPHWLVADIGTSCTTWATMWARML